MTTWWRRREPVVDGPAAAALARVTEQLAAALDRSQSVIEAQARVIERQSALVAELRRGGFDPAAAVTIRPDQHEPELPDLVAAAIEEVAHPGSALAVQLERRARGALARGEAPDRVARRIVLGGDSEEGMAVVSGDDDEDEDDLDREARLYTDEDED